MLPSEYQPHYVSAECRDDVVVVSFGLKQLTDDENVEILGRELFCLVDQYNCEKVVLDMAGVSFITSSVLGKIITLHRKQSRNNGRLVLCRLEAGVIETLETSRLINYFHTAEGVDDAIAAVK